MLFVQYNILYDMTNNLILFYLCYALFVRAHARTLARTHIYIYIYVIRHQDQP